MNFYRYELVQYSNFSGDDDYYSSLPATTKLVVREFNLIKETPKGYWISYGAFTYYRGKGRWVSKTSKKRYAYPTKEEALNNYIKRTERRIKYLKTDLDACESGLRLAKTQQIITIQNEIQRTTNQS